MGQGLHRRLRRARPSSRASTLGAFVDGIHGRGRAYAGGALDWLTPFALFTGVGLVVAYALLGCTWLIMKTEGALQARMMRAGAPARRWGLLRGDRRRSACGRRCAHPTSPSAGSRCPTSVWFAPVPVLVRAVHGIACCARCAATPQAAPFLLTLALVFLGYSGLGISLWPNIIPPDISIWEAAGPPQSLGFTLVGALLIIPIILGYTGFAYYVVTGCCQIFWRKSRRRDRPFKRDEVSLRH